MLFSLGKLQPWCELDIIVMAVIPCISFVADEAASHFIFNQSDVVSAIGTFAVGLIGNIYSHMFGETAFTVIVTVLVSVRDASFWAGSGWKLTSLSQVWFTSLQMHDHRVRQWN